MDVYLPSIGIWMRLAHLNQCLKNAGDQVPAGVPVAKSGGRPGNQPNAGNSSAPHLHWEANDKESGAPSPLDPSRYAKYLILSSTPPATTGTITKSGDTTAVQSISPTATGNNAQLPSITPSSASPSTANVASTPSTASGTPASVSKQTSYGTGIGKRTVFYPAGNNQTMGGSQSMSVGRVVPIMADEKEALNRYHALQILEFLYKNG